MGHQKTKINTKGVFSQKKVADAEVACFLQGVGHSAYNYNFDCNLFLIAEVKVTRWPNKRVHLPEI